MYVSNGAALARVTPGTAASIARRMAGTSDAGEPAERIASVVGAKPKGDCANGKYTLAAASRRLRYLVSGTTPTTVNASSGFGPRRRCLPIGSSLDQYSRAV